MQSGKLTSTVVLPWTRICTYRGNFIQPSVMSRKSNESDMLGSTLPSMVNSDNSASSNSSEVEYRRSLSRKMSSPHLCENIMRQVERDPYEVYEHAKVLGTGSMVSREAMFTAFGCLVNSNNVLKIFHFW